MEKVIIYAIKPMVPRGRSSSSKYKMVSHKDKFTSLSVMVRDKEIQTWGGFSQYIVNCLRRDVYKVTSPKSRLTSSREIAEKTTIKPTFPKDLVLQSKELCLLKTYA